MSEKTKNIIRKAICSSSYAAYLWFMYKVSNISDEAWLYATGVGISAALFGVCLRGR